MGQSAMERTIACVRILPLDNPTNTSAPTMASSKVCTSRRSVANSFFCSVSFSLSLVITPFESIMMIFSFTAPSAQYNFVHEMAAAPAPLTTILTLEISLPATSSAFFNPAAEMMAVPCWSSCITGMFRFFFSLSSI